MRENLSSTIQTGSHFILRIGMIGMLYLISVLASNILSAHQFGIYEYAINWVDIMLLLVLLGGDRYIVRLLPEYHLKKLWGDIKGLIIFTALSALILTLLFVVGTIAILQIEIFRLSSITSFEMYYALSHGHWIPLLQQNQWSFVALWYGILIASPLIFLRAIIRLLQTVLQSIFRPIIGQVPETILLNGGMVLIMVVIFFAGLGGISANMLILIYTVIAVFTVIVMFVLLRRSVPDEFLNTKAKFHTKQWISIGMPFMISTGLTMLILRLPIIIIGFIGTPTDVGIMSVMIRVASAVTLFQISASLVVSPRFSQLLSQDKYEQLQRVMTIISTMMSLAGTGMSILLVLFSTPILGLFGTEYLNHTNLLHLLAIGLAISANLGLANPLLMMAGYEKLVVKWTAFLFACSVLLTFYMIDRYGLLGGAISWILIDIINNAWSMLAARHTTGINSLPFIGLWRLHHETA